MRKFYLSLTAAALALAGCDAANKADAPANDSSTAEAGATDTAAIESELKSIEAAWVGEYNAKDIDKLAGHYADDAALANPGAALATDAASRRAGIEGFVADPSLKLEFASDRAGVARSGELAYTRGHYSMTATDPETKKAKTETGSYLTVWKKQADGSWKAVEDFVTPGPEAAK